MKVHYLEGPLGEPDDDGNYDFEEHQADLLWSGYNEDGERVVLVENSTQYPGVVHSIYPLNITSYGE